MKIVLMIIICSLMLFSNESDWDSSSSWTDNSPIEEDETNVLFEKAKIENRANRTYKDKVYKYITGDYEVENNTIELSTVRLNDNIQNEDIDVNVYVENLNVEGNEYKDGIDLKRNRYKNFVKNDENHLTSFDDILEQEVNPAYDNVREEGLSNENFLGRVSRENSRYSRVSDEDISIIEELDLREENDLKEVNVLIEDVNIFVD